MPTKQIEEIDDFTLPSLVIDDFPKILESLKSLDSDRKAALSLYLVDTAFPTQFTYFDVDISILQREIEIAETLTSDQARLDLAVSLLTDLISHLPEPVASGS